jgi:adenosylcobinamide kinase/adenosylcobinamide-phosphate guanylyltransferase
MKQLILGGARSGKSRLAEQIAIDSGLPVTYIATATAGDDEMKARIELHRQQRPDHWQTIEAPLNLAETLQQHAAEDHCIMVDCLTLWLSNHLCAENNLATICRQLTETITTLPGTLIMVSNEVGMGVVPMGELSRQFVDESGRLHQALAQQCDRVILTVAGLPHILKGAPL